MTEPHDVRDVHVVPHTHWDREWYQPAGRFRQRLVALLDELLDAEPGEGVPPTFLLDGQAVVLDDYLSVRPDRAAALGQRLRDGALEAGPWYVLADELIVGGEALVRNLLAGRRTLAALGASPPPVLYSPDAFGHAAALPALAVGFGCDLVIAWRGLGGARWPAGDAFRWRAPDGSVALLHHLPPDGYELGSSLPTDAAASADRWERLREALDGRSTLGVLLVQNGADHHALQAGWRHAYDELTRAASPRRVHVSSLRAFAAAVVERAAGAELPGIEGELRDSYGYAWTLQGTFASRAEQKRRNAMVERTLVRDVEPWFALGTRAADERARALVNAAWTMLLLCHPHDTLCGCSTDEVARAMDARLDDAASQAAGLRHDALLAVLGHDEAVARDRVAEWRPAVVVRNAAARERGGAAEVELLLPVGPAPVGPGSAARRGGAHAAPGSGGRPGALGGGVPVQVLDHELAYARVESPRHYPRNEVVERVRAVAWVPPVAGYGTRSFALDGASRDAVPGDVPATPVVVSNNRMENGLLDVSVGSDGSMRVATADRSWQATALVGFEDVGDAGDLYTHSPLGRPLTAAWFADAHTVHRGPLRGELEARWRMRIPAHARAGEPPLARPAARSGRHVEITLVVRLTLDAGAPFVRVAVSGDNLARDHRLRVVFHTGVAGAAVYADAAFGPVRRRPIVVPADEQLAERVPPTAPLHRYVSLFGERAGATLFADGLAEYEAMDDGRVAVTLVRAVGQLSRGDLPERPGHAGWPVPTPEAQCAGAFAGGFALLPHGPRDDATLAAIERAADDVLLPLRGDTLRSAVEVPEPTFGAELEGAALSCCAVKPAERAGWTVLRCVNASDAAVDGSWTLGRDVAEAWTARLDETPVARLDPDGRAVAFRAPARAIVTLLVRWAPA